MLESMYGSMNCMMCSDKATWFRVTQFAGEHPFCEPCANKESDFKKDGGSSFFWTDKPKIIDKSVACTKWDCKDGKVPVRDGHVPYVRAGPSLAILYWIECAVCKGAGKITGE